MKTSNKLLLGAVLLAVVILIAANIILKTKGKKDIPVNVQTELNLTDSIAETDTVAFDSIPVSE